MPQSALRPAARLATAMIALLITACKTGSPALADMGSGGPPPQLEIGSATSASSGSVIYRVNNDNVGIAGYVRVAPEEAWKTLLETYNDLKLPITALDASKRKVSSSEARAPRTIGGKPLHDYLDCGSGISGPRADSYDVAYTLVSVVMPATGDSTAIRSSLAGKASTRGGTSSPPVDCTSTGRLERRLAQLVRLKLDR